MGKYIILSFDKDFLVFSTNKRLPCPEDILNSNRLFHNRLVYTIKYFNRNDKDIMSLVNKILIDLKINKVYLEEYGLVDLVLKFIKILKLEKLYIKNFKSLSINQCNLIINNKFLTYINAFFMPNEYLKKTLRSKKKVNLNYVDTISDKFMVAQDAIDAETLYFKKTIHLEKNITYIEKDMKEFLKLNIYLKSIHLHYFDKKVLESIIKCLKEDNRENIIIFLYQNNEDNIQKEFNYLKLISKKYLKELDGEIRIVYSKNFIKNNLFKQLTYNNIKISLIIVFYVLFVSLIFNEFYNYSSRINLERLNYELYIKHLNSSTNGEESSSDLGTDEGIIDMENEENEKSVEEKYTLNKSFDDLKFINKDTVGWLTVNNTKINYPVVQADSNEYYLKRDFYNMKTNAGWVFMDFRNNSKSLDDNTIIYGHNLRSKLMFGTLSNVLKASWYKNKSNQIITFDTENSSMKWQIFSIYTTEYTVDYLMTNFNNKNIFTEFIDIVLSRSIYNFSQKINYGDKILTLSTCSGASSANRRLVVHAKLIQ